MERWRDCLAALVPVYDEEGGNGTLIITEKGDVFQDKRTIKWNLRRLARHFSVDLEAVRRNQGEYFHYRQGLPLPLSPALVLVPVKTRRAVGKNDGCHSYLNPNAVVELRLSKEEQGDCPSLIILSGEYRLPCYYTLKTVRKRLRDGTIALEKHCSTLMPGSIASQASTEEYKEFLEKLVCSLVTGTSNGVRS